MSLSCRRSASSPPPRGPGHHLRLPCMPSPRAAFLLHLPTAANAYTPPPPLSSSPQHLPVLSNSPSGKHRRCPIQIRPVQARLATGRDQKMGYTERGRRERGYACVQRDAARVPIVVARSVRAMVGLVHGILPSRRPPAPMASSLTSQALSKSAPSLHLLPSAVVTGKGLEDGTYRAR
ncbi:hypothetical protein B0H13DRAFT_2367365 [Mycena leptocephala]|nr:hypothetical protein B0H13DRAFT_2367365 [Mycena leptocephala]